MTKPPVWIRAAHGTDSPALGALHVAAWRESYPGLVPAAMLDALSVETRAAAWREILAPGVGLGRTAAYLVECDGQLAGFASCGPQRSRQLQLDGFGGEISALYVLKAFQGRGLGRLLMATLAADLGRRGFIAAALWVLADNRQARRFYERLDGRLSGSREDIRGEHVLIEVAYGWPGLDRLVDKATSGAAGATVAIGRTG